MYLSAVITEAVFAVYVVLTDSPSSLVAAGTRAAATGMAISFQGLECQAINGLNDSLVQCAFAVNRSDCFDEDGWVNYSLLFYCGTGAASKLLPLLVSVAFLVLLFVALGATAEDFMCPSLECISKTLRLSENIAVSASLP